MRTAAGSGIVLAKFHEGGAASFLATPLHELFGGTVPLEDLLPRRQIQSVSAQIAEAGDDARRISIFEQFLLARWNSRILDPCVAATVRAIQAQRGWIRIGLVARRLGISRDALEKRFRAAVGTSLKRLASILRLRHAVDSYREGVALGDLAQRAGYYDQAHFTRQFRSMVGEAPQAFLRSNRHW
jgi:AraC-like DNA-binding protein